MSIYKRKKATSKKRSRKGAVAKTKGKSLGRKRGRR